MELQAGHQIYLNKKYFLDVIDISDKITVRVKYLDNPNSNYYKYKEIKLPLDLFNDCKGNDEIGVVYCNVSNVELKKQIGGLVNKLVKEPNVYEIFENVVAASPGNTGGMGAVANPGLSGTPGITGTSGSGDISSFISTGSKSSAHTHYDFGLQKLPKGNKKHIDLLTKGKKKKKKKDKVKKPVLNTINLSENLDNVQETENEYKLKLFTFLDYPVENDYDIEVIESISEYKDDFTVISVERIKAYLKIFYETNKNFLNKKVSEYVLNQIKILADI